MFKPLHNIYYCGPKVNICKRKIILIEKCDKNHKGFQFYLILWPQNFLYSACTTCPGGGMVDTGDLKSLGGNSVRVQVPPRALFFFTKLQHREGGTS